MGENLGSGHNLRGAAVVIADDHPLLRQAVRAWIEAKTPHRVCAEVEDGRDVVDVCEREHPDVLVLDLGLPSMDGIAVTQAVADRCPDTRVLIYTGRESPFEAVRAFRAGAMGFLSKTRSLQEFERALNNVARGERDFPDDVLQEYAEDLLERALGGVGGSVLTERELVVVTLLAAGLRTCEIAEELEVTSRTVSRHKTRIMSKLGAHSDADLVRRAMQIGVVS